MLKRSFTVFFLLLACSLMVFAQNKVVLKPIGSTYISKSGHAPEFTVVRNTKGTTTVQNKIAPPPMKFNNVQGTLDTLSYRDSYGTVDNWNTNFVTYGGDVEICWFEAPADLTIKAIGATFSSNGAADAGDDVQGSFKIYKVGNGITADDLSNVGPAARKQGTFVNSSASLGYVAFEDESDGSGYINSGNLAAFPFAEDIWSDVGFGYPLTPATSPSTDPVLEMVATMEFGFEPTLLRGEIFGVVFKNENPDLGNTAQQIGIWSYAISGNPSPYSWKFYATGRTTGDSSTAYWYSREYIWGMAAVVDLTGDRPPVISNVTSLGTTLSNADREVSATITDDNPSGSTAGGVTAATLQWSTDGGTTWNDIAMSNTGDVYSGMVPGQAAGANVSYRIVATDDNTNSSTSPPNSYKIFIKVNDVLFLYNTGDYTTNTAKRLYIGSGNDPDNSYIINPVKNDVWLASDGTSEAADVMSLYNYVVEVSGSFPDADFSDAVKAYLAAATAGNTRNYFLSAQDYGCYITGDCSNITFAAGDFQYDYLGVGTLGPQDLPGAIVGLTGVSGDPLSGWAADYATTNSVGYYYDPSYELGFTSYIDALTPTSGATATFMSDGQVVGVRNEGDNWKTGFITFDYAASNFRSDTSAAGHDDAGYAWGITVGNQALAFLEWAGYVVDVKPVKGATPTAYSLRQNYPNPFNPTTLINYSIPNAGNVVLSVYDVLGSKVTDLVNTFQQAGSFNVTWDGTNQYGTKVTSGTYFYQLKTDNGFVETKKMILLK